MIHLGRLFVHRHILFETATNAHVCTPRHVTQNHSFPLCGRLSHQQQSLRTNYTKNRARDNDIPLSANLSQPQSCLIFAIGKKNPWGSFYQITSWPLNLSWRSFNFMQRNEQLKWQKQYWSWHEDREDSSASRVTPGVWPRQARTWVSIDPSRKGAVDETEAYYSALSHNTMLKNIWFPQLFLGEREQMM